jgi:hypothetical protein
VGLLDEEKNDTESRDNGNEEMVRGSRIIHSEAAPVVSDVVEPGQPTTTLAGEARGQAPVQEMNLMPGELRTPINMPVIRSPKVTGVYKTSTEVEENSSLREIRGRSPHFVPQKLAEEGATGIKKYPKLLSWLNEFKGT